MKFIKCFENNMRKLSVANQLTIRNRSLNIINGLPGRSLVTDELEEAIESRSAIENHKKVPQ